MQKITNIFPLLNQPELITVRSRNCLKKYENESSVMCSREREPEES
jgi:hypothetical protein